MKVPTTQTILPLHTHTAYSLMDGVSDVQQYVKFCSENGLEACSCTDHGYILGLYDLITKTKDTEIKGIPGLEAYLAPHDKYNFNQNLRKFDYFHLTLWAKNYTGYQNLLALSSASWGPGRVVKRFGQPKPRISWEDLNQYNDGIICGSGCIEGPIVKAYLRNEKDMAAYNAELLMDLFGRDGRLFMEVMPHSVDRDWETKGVIQVEGENGVKYTFKHNDVIETELGTMTAKQACEKGVAEIYSSITDRPQDFPISSRNIDSPVEFDEDEVETPTTTIARNIIHES